MIRRLAALLIFLPLLMGCGTQTTEETQFSQRVEQAVRATLTAESATRLAEETLTAPTFTAIVPTQEPTPTLTVVMPTPTVAPTQTPTATSSDQEEMEEVLTVVLTELDILPVDTSVSRFSPEARFVLQYDNKGTRGIRAFTGVVVFSDLFDRPKKRLILTYDHSIQPEQQVIDSDKMYELNIFMEEDKWMMTTSLENMRVVFEPMSILFSDGSRLGQVQ